MPFSLISTILYCQTWQRYNFGQLNFQKPGYGPLLFDGLIEVRGTVYSTVQHTVYCSDAQ